MSRRGRMAGALAAVALLLGGAVLGVVAFRALRPRAASYRVSVRAVPPTTTNWWMPGEEPCPTGGRGEGPPPSEQASQSGATPLASGSQPVGPGQILVYELLVEAATTAAGKGDLTTALAFDQPTKGQAFDRAGIVCAFVDEADPSTTSVGSSATVTAKPSGDDGALQADVLVTGLGAESTAVVELWVRAASELDRNATSFPARVVSVTPPAGQRATVMVPAARTARSTNADRATVKLDLSLQGEEPKPGGPIHYRMLITNPSADALATQLVTHMTPDATITLSDITVRDTAGVPTTCTRDGAAVSCSTAYLIPGEVVTVDVTGGLAADTPTLFQGAGASCRKQGQDVCTTAQVVALAGSQSSARPVELATDLPAKDTLGLSKLAPQADAALYVGDTTDFVYVVSAGTAAAKNVTIVDPACGPITLVGGDDGADGVLNPGERWTFRCSAIVDRSQAADVSVTAVAPTGETIGTTTRLATPILDPSIALRALDNADKPTVEVLNSGDTDLSDVAVRGRGCAIAEKSGDAEGDGVLAPGERWTFTCNQQTGTVRAYATDLAGGAVTAALVG